MKKRTCMTVARFLAVWLMAPLAFLSGYGELHGTDASCICQPPGQPGKWFMNPIGFDDQGYSSFVADDSPKANQNGETV